jgi:sialate O-acetylesterase
MRSSLVLSIALVLTVRASLCATGQPFTLASLFTDNMVLQQQRTVPVFGTGPAGSTVTVKGSWGAAAKADIDSAGMWNAPLATPKAGGPYSVEVTNGDSTIILSNVLIGEVWLCSGQSNMEMPLQGWPPNDTVAGAKTEIEGAANPHIRFFTVARKYAIDPMATCRGRWVESSPATAPTFSATAYYFGKHLYEALHVPIGLIHSSWGGTPVEAWTDAQALRTLPEFDSSSAKIEETRDSMSVYDAWLDSFPTLKRNEGPPATRWLNLHFDDDSLMMLGVNDSSWHLMNLPVYWETTEVGNFDGVVWFRKLVSIPHTWIGRDLVIELGPIDDMDVTYVNGVRVGSYEVEGGWKIDRTYRIPASVVEDSLLQIAVRVLDNQGGGGIWGNGQRMCLHPEGSDTTETLEGAWRYLPVADLVADTFYVFGVHGNAYFSRPHLPMDVGPSMPTALYNGMIAPLVPNALRGVIWYQGESNVDHPALYAKNFAAMIEGWRREFRQPSLPFYFVQIAPYAYEGGGQSQLIREAQLKTLALENTGMAVTLDIGNFKNIHPADKNDVGVRLARWALARLYKKKVVCSGPLPKSVRATGNAVEIRFAYADHGLLLRDTVGDSGFEIAGQDSVFRKASVAVKGDRIRVFRPGLLRPLAARYAFSNTPVATLFNRDGLPAPSFRTDSWTIPTVKP